jgi:hypothetical protein
MAQYSDTHKQRQPEGHELNKSELSDADFTRKLLEFYDDTYLDLPSFAELVGRGTNTVAKWLGERTCSTWPIKAELPSPSEQAEILARLAELVAEVRQLLECIRKSLNWLRDRRFSYQWVWKFFDWKGVELDLLPTGCLKDAALYKLERLRCKMKPERPEDRFRLQSLREINFRLLGYINRNKDLPGFSPDKLDAICKAAGYSLAELARMVDRNVVARIDRAYKIDFYPEDCLELFSYDDVFKTPPVTAEYLSKVMYDDRKAKAINPEVWRVILEWAEETAKEQPWEKAWEKARKKVWESGTRFGLEPETFDGDLEKATAGTTDSQRGLSGSEIAEGADEAAQEGAALPEGQEQAGSNTAPSDSDSPGRQKRRRSAALATRKALVSSISDYLEKVGDIKLLNRARDGDKKARRLLRQAAAVLRLYRKGKLTAGQTIEKLWRIRFITPEHLGKRGIQNILADLLPCAKSTVCGSRVLSAICAEVKSDGARRYSEDAQNYDSFRQDDR